MKVSVSGVRAGAHDDLLIALPARRGGDAANHLGVKRVVDIRQQDQDQMALVAHDRIVTKRIDGLYDLIVRAFLYAFFIIDRARNRGDGNPRRVRNIL